MSNSARLLFSLLLIIAIIVLGFAIINIFQLQSGLAGIAVGVVLCVPGLFVLLWILED